MKRALVKHLFLAGVTAISLKCASAEALLAGVKTTGMGAASTAYPIDSFAGAYNPASITDLCDRMDIGISWVQIFQRASFHDFAVPTSITNTSGSNDGSINGARTPNYYVPEFGVNKRWLCANWNGCEVEFASSFIIYNRDEIKTKYKNPIKLPVTIGGSPDPVLFGTTPTKFEYTHETAALVLATKIMNMHSIGVAINYNLQRVKIDGLEKLKEFSVSPNNVTNHGYNYSNGVGVILGYMLDWKCWKLGWAWQPKTHMQRFHKYKGFIANHGKFDLPERLNVGFSWRVFCPLTVALDYEFIHWRRVRQFGNSQNDITNPIHRFGAVEGTAFGWKNQGIYRFGAEYEINRCFTIRAGYRHANNPIREHFTMSNMLTMNTLEDVVTLGWTYKFDACNEINFFYACGMTKLVTGEHSVPTSYPTVKNGKINPCEVLSPPSCTQGNGEIDLRARNYALGISWGYYY